MEIRTSSLTFHETILLHLDGNENKNNLHLHFSWFYKNLHKYDYFIILLLLTALIFPRFSVISSSKLLIR